MAEVVLSGAIRSNLLSIQNTARLLDDTQLRLSTGLKVNSAVDDPTAFFQARSLNTRAGDLNRLVDSLQQSINTIQTADEGITSLQKLVESAKALANRALETPIVASSSEGPRQVVTDPDVTATAFASGIASGDVLTVQVGGGSVRSVTVGSKTIGELVSAINAITGVSAEITNERSLKIEGDSGRALVIGSSAGSVANDLGLAGSFTNGTNRDKFETDYNELRLQIDQLAGDANYQGVNLLRGDDLTINFNGWRPEATGNHRPFVGKRGEPAQYGPRSRCGKPHPAHPGLYLRFQPWRGGNSPGLHRPAHQYAGRRRGRSDFGRHERRRRQSACLADPPAARFGGALHRLAVRTKRAAALLEGLSAAVHCCLLLQRSFGSAFFCNFFPRISAGFSKKLR